jgi:hypothetical protein
VKLTRYSFANFNIRIRQYWQISGVTAVMAILRDGCVTQGENWRRLAMVRQPE